MSERLTLFADVILPVPIHQAFTYRIPFDLNDHFCFGQRVIVPFGKNKLVTGIVIRIHEEIPTVYQAKYIEHLLDELPIITEKQFEFWKWIASYYMAPIGDVMNAALPSNFKLASETKIVVHPEFDSNFDQLDERETKIIETLEVNEEIDLKELSEIVGIKTIQPLIKKLIERRIVATKEEISNRYSPKTILCVSINSAYQDESNLQILIEELEQSSRNAKQLEAILMILKESLDQGGIHVPIPKKKLLEKGISLSALNTLDKNEIITCERYQIDRLMRDQKVKLPFKELTEAQNKAYEEINSSFEKNSVTLLHGVTGSGKTEVYVQL
ncbi:MAG: primosomal protein N', partial [Crocinitomicaceae bacterium]